MVLSPSDAAALKTATPVLSYLARLIVLAFAAYLAYDIRLYAIREYGRLIHEFDPWFNFHATRYLFEHGLKKFFTWFDHTAWYPLGRPVGTTIYPGMQLTSVGIWHVLDRIGMGMSLNDICVFVPAWFGGIASVLTGYFAAECSGIPNAAPAAALVMSIIPAHIMRSMGGGYDNESIAVTAMMATFFLWNRCLRNASSWPVSILAAFAYTYMVAAWGGYTFVINMIGVHAAVLVLIGRYDSSVYKSYTLFYIIGTFGAIQVPCVAWVPLKSLEQIGPLLVFLGYQVLELCEVLRKQRKLEKGSEEYYQLRRNVVLGLGAIISLVISVLVGAGAFGPVSLRVKSLFIKHTRTGNPLVDSVAEHQATSNGAYWSYLHYACLTSLPGFVMSWNWFNPTNTGVFLILYSLIGYYFSQKMSRLIILMGPLASALTGIFLAVLFNWVVNQAMLIPGILDNKKAELDAKDEKKADASATSPPAKQGKKGNKAPGPGLTDNVKSISSRLSGAYQSYHGKVARIGLAIVSCYFVVSMAFQFFAYCHMFAFHSANPTLVFKTEYQGQKLLISDYLDSYIWLRENTPEDARVLSWWDYGYQITGIGNRTTLADGNTWNLEHISLIARCLTSKEKRAHELIRHLADYVLVWAGGGGDDLAKSPHIARIGNSVYSDICPNDPLCYSFGFDEKRNPTPTMAASLLYKLTMKDMDPRVTVNEKLFKEVHSTKYGLVRIYKVMKVSMKSKKWLADPANRLCDRPGSWYCPGQYPPDLPERVGERDSHKDLNYESNQHI